MHVIVVGAGAAGLGAAWALMEAGVNVTVLESADQAGGRCRTTYWHGEWRITGALAFVSIEDNLKEQARKMGIYADEYLEDMSGLHEHHIMTGRKDIISIPDFEPISILKCRAIPVHERLALARLLPRLVRQSFKNNWRDPTTAVPDDFETACGYLRKYSPTFVDYLLEPIMQHFNGFSEDDYSLGWIVWLLAGAPWSSSWWTFKERGVGKLTHEMATQLSARPNVNFLYGAEARQLRHSATGAEADILMDGRELTVKGDALVCAVPGQMVNGLVSNLDDSYQKFFDSVRYGALYLSYFLVRLPEATLPDAVILPSADGFETTAYYNIQPADTEGMAIVHAEMKGEASRRAASMNDDEVRDAIWADVVAATPAMQDCEISDFMLVRNDIAIVKPYVGYLQALHSFRQQPALPRLAFAGDYLITSTVGQAHYTGLQAAKQLLGL